MNCFPESANLICRSMDISICFIESLGVRDNESRLYILVGKLIQLVVFPPYCTHTYHKLWTKICEIRQNFQGDLIKFCEIFLNITLELLQYSLKSFFHVRSL